MKTRTPISRLFAYLLLSSIHMIMLCCWKPNHTLVGKWGCFGFIELSVYKDGVAAFAGEKASWEAIDNETIRLEYTEDGDEKIAEMTLEDEIKDGRRTATVSSRGLSLPCSEVQKSIGELLE